jgi:F-type H+-transporting ATPase subunit delta
MAEVTTLARPYAEAAFAFAKETGGVDEWSKVLGALAEVASLTEMQTLIARPNVDRFAVSAIFADAVKTNNQGVKNLLTMLAENKRLNVIGALSALFEELKAQANQNLTATVTAAFALSEQQTKQITEALTKKYGQTVEVEAIVDASMGAGAIVKVGDVITDASLKAQVAKLSAALTN